MLEDRISRLRSLIAKRDEIDAELALLLGVQPKKPRGRPPKSYTSSLLSIDESK
jgi:hypothetical protein